MSFLQEKPIIPHPYLEDLILRSLLKRLFPKELFKLTEKSLSRFGTRVREEVEPLGVHAENHPPQLITYDAWGARIDHIQVSKSWEKLKDLSAQEGLVSIGYERPFEEFSRIYQFSKLYLFTPASAIYTCPLAMTDGAARLLTRYASSKLRKQVLAHLISKDPKTFWISGQWMTEKTGGSDVQACETIAKKTEIKKEATHLLSGNKWFTSAMPSEIAMSLAHVQEKGITDPKVSLFYVEVLSQIPKNISILKLKDKLGTRALPTAELELKNTQATLLGERGKGISHIATLFNITRIYNTCCAVSFMKHMLGLAKNYAKKRKAFQKTLFKHPLHIRTLSEMELIWNGSMHLMFYLTLLLGKEDTQKATPEEVKMLRILTPLAKLYTAKQAISLVSEALECIGGIGYLEDSGIPKFLRDVQTLSIWEGTTNVLSLDMLRSIEKEDTLNVFFQNIQKRLVAITHIQLKPFQEKTKNILLFLKKQTQAQSFQEKTLWQASSRTLAMNFTELLIASLLLEHTQWAFAQKAPSDANYFFTITKHWCTKILKSSSLKEPSFVSKSDLDEHSIIFHQGAFS